MKLYFALASLLTLSLAGCTSVPTNCKDLATNILKNSYQDATKNQGTYIRRIYLSRMPYEKGGNSMFNQYSYFVISIDNAGSISENWWKPWGNTTNGLTIETSNNAIPSVPEPQMKTSDGIVCNVWGVLPSQERDTESEGYIITGVPATLSQDRESYQVKY